MLTHAQEKLIRNLLTKKGRREEKLCIAEGKKLIDDIHDFVELTVTSDDTALFDTFTNTETPQDILAIARIPNFDSKDIFAQKTVVLLDHVQDPGNVGAFFRLALAFNAGLILRECADPFSPKVIRSSAGSVFFVPHIECNTEEAQTLIRASDRTVLKFEKTEMAIPFTAITHKSLLIFGNEGNGILGDYVGDSVYIDHNPQLESLSVSHAGAIALHTLYQTK